MFRTCSLVFFLFPVDVWFFLFVSLSDFLFFTYFFPGQQLTIHLQIIGYPCYCMAVSKGCPMSGVNFEFTATFIGKQNGVLQQRDLKNMKTDVLFQVGHTPPSMPFLQSQVPRKIKEARQRTKNLPFSLNFWFQTWIHRTKESLGWVPAMRIIWSIERAQMRLPGAPSNPVMNICSKGEPNSSCHPFWATFQPVEGSLHMLTLSSGHLCCPL